jgi:catechol 2,3-dioxygenase-like lactoylglutathione lyase family enzyme
VINRMSHVTVWVKDQNSARDFYVDKLGMEVRTDQRMGDFRWLTVGFKTQPELELILMPVAASPMLDEAAAQQLRSMVEAGKLAPGVLAVDDCRKSYDELRAKGVEFKSPPQERPYGVEAMLVDDSGNLFSMTERRR